MHQGVLPFTYADPDYYEPLERYPDPSPRYRPVGIPSGWDESRRGIWTVWQPTWGTCPDQGWKIHISTTLSRASYVLDLVAAAAICLGVRFKHITSEFTFVYMHQKHGARVQSGKFCTVYPPDVEVAGRLLDRLADELRGEEGPYILTDRRYRGSRTVHYRYGAFRMLARARADGTPEDMLRDHSGAWVQDSRTTHFVLPPGVVDPFADEPVAPAPSAPGVERDGIGIGGYRVLRALAYSNAGGAYQGVDRTGRLVFLKEARAHNGLHWDHSTAKERLRREHRILCDLHEHAPGLSPEPVEYLQQWEHEFLVTELVQGRTLLSWVAQRNPYVVAATAEGFDSYFASCRCYLEQLAVALDRLHQAGFRFGDLNPRNVLVDDDDRLRLIDFEACGPLTGPPHIMAAPGFGPVRKEDHDGTGADEYGLSAIALAMILPVHQAVLRRPAMLAHLRADARRYAEVPDDIWRLATRHVRGCTVTGGAGSDPSAATEVDTMPSPERVAADPVGCLRWLKEAIDRELAAVVAPEDPDRMYPSVPRGYRANTLCVAYGAAGVLHALHHAGMAVPDPVIERLRREALERCEELPPGLHTGSAGIGWVLAELGYLDEAAALITAAAAHPILDSTSTWGWGTAGVGTSLLALYGHTGDEHQLTRAVARGDELCAAVDLTPSLGPRNAIGLLHGRAGLALFLHHLWQATGNKQYLRRGTELMHAELDRAREMPGNELGFPDDDTARRAMVYLAAGSAGVGHVLTRYVLTGGDTRLADATPRVFGYANKQMTVEPGLYQGLAGLAFALADHADHAGRYEPRYQREALQAATALFKHAIPAPDGRVRFLGEASLRYSAELWSGSAGILLALDRVLDGSSGHFFTLHDQPSREAKGGDNP